MPCSPPLRARNHGAAAAVSARLTGALHSAPPELPGIGFRRGGRRDAALFGGGREAAGGHLPGPGAVPAVSGRSGLGFATGRGAGGAGLTVCVFPTGGR